MARRQWLIFALLAGIALPAFSGEALPPGPPWQPTWEAAKKDALEHGRPIFAYFTKRY